MISSQKERDFEGMHYDDINEVISIWICLNMDSNSMSHYHLVKDERLEPCNWRGNPDLINIVILGIKDELPEHDEKYELHRLLASLLTNKLDVSGKLDIISSEYDIEVDEEIKEDTNIMCNLGEGIYSRGNKEGIKKIILNMKELGCEEEKIAMYVNETVEKVQAVINEVNTHA